MDFVGRGISQRLLSNEEQLARNFTTWRERRTEATVHRRGRDRAASRDLHGASPDCSRRVGSVSRRYAHLKPTINPTTARVYVGILEIQASDSESVSLSKYV